MGYGLLSLLSPTTSAAKWIGYQVFYGVGSGSMAAGVSFLAPRTALVLFNDSPHHSSAGLYRDPKCRPGTSDPHRHGHRSFLSEPGWCRVPTRSERRLQQQFTAPTPAARRGDRYRSRRHRQRRRPLHPQPRLGGPARRRAAGLQQQR